MNIGNFLTVFSILIALVGFAYNSNRKIIIYKLSKSDYIIAIVLVLLANYLLLFDWVEANGWYFDCFMHEGNSYLLPNQWAYIVTSLLLFYVMYKFWVRNRIPERNRTKLLRYYEELVLSDIPFLINCICKYHQEEIQNDIAKVNKNTQNENNGDLFAWDEPKADEVKTKQETVLQRIVLNHSFIRESIRHSYPLFFLEQVCELKTDRLVGIKEAVECYYRTLLRKQNSVLVDAIRHTNNILQDDKCNNVAYRLHEYKFSSLTCSNIDFVVNLKVWKSFGEEGLRDAETSEFFNKQASEWYNDEYNKHPAKLCLNFYDILIRQIIYEYVKNGKANAEPPFIYPYYLYLICDALAVDEEKYVGTYVESFWNDLMSTLSGLLKVHEDHNIHLYYVDLLNILKSLIMISDYSAERKTELLTWLIEYYIEKDSVSNCDVYFKDKLKDVLTEIKSENSLQIKNAMQQIDAAKYSNYPNYSDVIKFLNGKCNENSNTDNSSKC